MKDVIRGQIAYPDPAGAMRANLVTGADANSVATYIAQCSGNPQCGITAASSTPATTTTMTTTTAPTTTTSSAGGSAAVVAAGKKVFASAGCAGCHTLKDAGATGTVGPNLDTLKPSQAIVAHQVTVGGGPMPAFKGTLTPAQIQAVATYVASVAGK
jgi:mono/diheme cytochrome c family protein